MKRHVLDDLKKYFAFSKRFGGRIERVAEAAKVVVDLPEVNFSNAFKQWLKEYDESVAADKHVAQHINILQMKLEILYRVLANRRLVKIAGVEPIHNIRSNVINIFAPLTSTGFVDYRGRLDFQKLFIDHANSYVAVDFCADIYRDLMRSRGEYPFGEGEQNFQVAVSAAVSALSYNNNQSFFRLMRFKNLPLDLETGS